MYVVTKEIPFERLTGEWTIFPVGTMIDYKRWTNNIKAELITITVGDIPGNDREYIGIDFDIEKYIELVTEDPSNLQIHYQKVPDWMNKGQQADRTYRPNQELPYTVQVEIRPSRIETNDFLKTILGENVIDIKPMKNNCYLIIYKEIKE